MTTPRVIHIVNYPLDEGTAKGGGVRTFVMGLTASAALNEFEHRQLSIMPNGERSGTQAESNSLYCPLPDLRLVPSYRLRQFMRPYFFAQRFKALLRQQGATIVHSHTPEYIDAQLMAAQYQNLPFIWTVHGYTKNHQYPVRYAKNISRVIEQLKQANGVIAPVSQATAAELVNDYPEADQHINVVYGGVDTRSLQANLTRDPNWYKSFHIQSSDHLIFGTLARLSPEKNLPHMIRAFASFLQRDPNRYDSCHLLIAGSGPQKNDLDLLIEQLHMTSNIHMLGLQSDVSRFLRQLDIFLLSSTAEGFPISIIEALFMGVPVITTNAGGVEEILGNGGGVVVDFRDLTAYSEALEFALNSQWRESASLAAVNIAQRFTIDRTAIHYARLYTELLERKQFD